MSKLVKLSDLSIKVTYRVGLGDIEIPKKVYEQLLMAYSDSESIDATMMKKNQVEAGEWLHQNIKEGDCNEWIAEIEDIVE